MAESLINSRIRGQDRQLYINGERIVGIQSLSIDKDLGLSNISYGGIGNNTVYYLPRRPQSTIANINSLLLNRDYFLSYVTGDSTVNAFILKNYSDNSPMYSMLNGYFDSFTCEYSIGTVPQINTSIKFIGNAGNIPTGSLGALALAELNLINILYNNISGDEDWGSLLASVTSTDDWETISGIITSSEDWNTSSYSYSSGSQLLIPHGGSITLNIDTFQTNRLQNFRIEVNSQKIPIYNIGNRNAARVELTYPIDVNCYFSFDIGNYESVQSLDIPENNIIKNLSLNINDYLYGQNIANYSFNNLNLINESYTINTNNNIVANLAFNTKIYGN